MCRNAKKEIELMLSNNSRVMSRRFYPAELAELIEGLLAQDYVSGYDGHETVVTEVDGLDELVAGDVSACGRYGSWRIPFEMRGGSALAFFVRNRGGGGLCLWSVDRRIKSYPGHFTTVTVTVYDYSFNVREK